MSVLLEAQLLKRSGGHAVHQTDKTGKIFKRNSTFSSGNLMKKWDSRTFQLSRDTISYFKSPNDARAKKQPKAALALAGAVLVASPEEEQDALWVTLVTLEGQNSRDLHLKFPSQSSLMQWREVLVKVSYPFCLQHPSVFQRICLYRTAKCKTILIQLLVALHNHWRQ